MSDKFTVVYWAENDAEAEIMLSMFRNYNIPCRKMQESYGATNGLSFGIFGQIAIAVPSDRVKEAEALIISMDDEIDEEENTENT